MDNKRLTPYLRRRCLALRAADRVALLSILRESLTASPRTETERLDSMAAAMASLTGLDIRRRVRQAEYVRARTIFAFTARQEGFAQLHIARFLGVNHATIHYMEKRMVDVFSLPEVYADYINLYNQFTNEIL